MKIGVLTGLMDRQLGLEDCYAAIAEAGFTAIDWSLNYTCNVRTLQYEGTCIFEKSLDEVIEHYAEELAIIRRHGLTISQAHAPFPAYITGHPEVTDYCIRIYNRIIELCGYAGCRNLVVHPICLSVTDMTDTPADIDRLNLHLLESLVPAAMQNDVTICLENLYVRNDMNFIEGACSDPYAAAKLIDTLNEKAGKEVFGMCLDTGHLNLLGKDMRTFIPVLGKRIKALHINENDGFSDQHLTPLAGSINWDAFCQALRDIGYEGDLSFETVGQTKKVLAFDKDLLVPWLRLICLTGENFRRRIQN